MTREELQAAAVGIFNAEKALLTKFEDLLSAFQEGLNELAEDMPTNPALNTPVMQLVTRAKTSAISQFGYEISNLRQQYGLVTPAATVAP